MLLVNATPLSNRSSCYSDVSDSLTAFDSLMMAGLCEHFFFPDIPERFSQNVFSPGGTVSVPRRTGLLQSSQRQCIDACTFSFLFVSQCISGSFRLLIIVINYFNHFITICYVCVLSVFLNALSHTPFSF